MGRNGPPELLLMLCFLSFFYVIASFVCLRGLPRTEWTLIVVGLLTTLLATFFGTLFSAEAAMNNGQVLSLANGVSGPLGRVGVLLVIDGVALCVLSRLGYPPPAKPTYGREEGIRESR